MLNLDTAASSLPIENQLNRTAAVQARFLRQLTTGSRINSGADDAAGLAIADGLDAGAAALNESAQNVTAGLSLAQTADGALYEITALLTRGVTLAVEAANGEDGGNRGAAADREFQALLAQIDDIAAGTSWNGERLFLLAHGVADRAVDDGSYASAGNTVYGNQDDTLGSMTFFVGDGSAGGSTEFSYVPPSVDARALGLTVDHGQKAGGGSQNFAANITLLNPADAKQALAKLAAAVGKVAGIRGSLGSLIEQLEAATGVATVEEEHLRNASDAVRAADIGAAVAQATRLSVLQQSGIAALRQSQQQARAVLNLLAP